MKYLIAIIAILVSVLLFITIDNSTKLHKQLLKNEQRRQEMRQFHAESPLKFYILYLILGLVATTMSILVIAYDLPVNSKAYVYIGLVAGIIMLVVSLYLLYERYEVLKP